MCVCVGRKQSILSSEALQQVGGLTGSRASQLASLVEATTVLILQTETQVSSLCTSISALFAKVQFEPVSSCFALSQAVQALDTYMYIVSLGAARAHSLMRLLHQRSAISQISLLSSLTTSGALTIWLARRLAAEYLANPTFAELRVLPVLLFFWCLFQEGASPFGGDSPVGGSDPTLFETVRRGQSLEGTTNRCDAALKNDLKMLPKSECEICSVRKSRVKCSQTSSKL